MEESNLEIAYEPDYTIEDKAFYEPLVIMKAAGGIGLPGWWNDGGTKVKALINAFKMDLTVHEACISAGISLRQYKYFCQVHPTFVATKGRLKGVLAIAAKQGLVADIQNPEGYRSRQWYLERKQPKLYGRAPELTLPADTSVMATLVQRAFSDKTGKVTISEATASVVKIHDEDKTD